MNEVFVMSGSNLGKTDARTLVRCIDEYGPPPTAMLIQEFLERYGQPRQVQICDVCGCLHHSHMATMCNSCFDAMRGVHMAQLVAALGLFGKAASQLGMVAFRKAINDTPFIFPSECAAKGFGAAYIEAVDPIADIKEGLSRMRSFLLVEPPVMPKINLSSIYDIPYAPTDESRPKRDRRNRGPRKHGKWWLS